MMLTSYKIISKARKRNKFFVALATFTCILFLSYCISKPAETKKDIRGENYAGSTSCKNCHQPVYDAFIKTAHANTSSAKLPEIVQAGFQPGSNVFEFNDSLKVVLENHSGQFYQTAYQNGQKIISRPFDLVIGSGRKAQSYLFFDSTKIFQLPLSYFVTEHSWANSPGFPAHTAKFDRTIPSGCLGCHSAFISAKKVYDRFQLTENFDRQAIVYGIDCERCHGPAAQHIAYSTEHSQNKEAKFISRISSLTRSQKTDMCSLCHSGVKDPQQSLFNFKPGDALSDFYFPEFGMPDPKEVDVHGKQSVLMMASKCYQLSNDLTCNSCHNVHVKERDNLAIFSARCISCHQQVNHPFAVGDKTFEATVKTNCIDCHMPLQASKVITLLTKQKTSAKPDYMRTHLINTYPEDSKRFIDSIKRFIKTN